MLEIKNSPLKFLRDCYFLQLHVQLQKAFKNSVPVKIYKDFSKNKVSNFLRV